MINRVIFLQAQSFLEHTFLTRVRRLKNGWPLSAPPRACFYHPQLLKKKFVKADITQLSPKKIWEVLIKIEGIQAISASDRWILPPPRSFRVKAKSHKFKIINASIQNQLSITIKQRFLEITCNNTKKKSLSLKKDTKVPRTTDA